MMMVRCGMLVAGVLCAAVSLGGCAGAEEADAESATEAKKQPRSAAIEPEPRPASRDEQYRRLVVGTWGDNYQGKRTMTLKEDGTGTMIVELSGIKATLFAKRLEFNMVWSIEDGRLKKRTLGGKPEMRVKMILKTMGDRVDEPILELTEDRLLLLDKDGATKYDWRRREGREGNTDLR